MRYYKTTTRTVRYSQLTAFHLQVRPAKYIVLYLCLWRPCALHFSHLARKSMALEIGLALLTSLLGSSTLSDLARLLVRSLQEKKTGDESAKQPALKEVLITFADAAATDDRKKAAKALERIASDDESQDAVETIVRAVAPVYLYKKADSVALRRYPVTSSFTLANVGEIEQGQPLVALLESEQTQESQAYRDFVSSLDFVPEVHVIGRAHAINPSGSLRAVKQITENRPGRAVSYMYGQAGTLGLYVRDIANFNLIGFCSASHVLFWDEEKTKPDAPILSPAPPPERLRSARSTYGRFMDGRILVPYTRADAADVRFNSADIAWARLENPGDAPDGNYVPDPQNPERLVRLQGVLLPEEIKLRVFERRKKPFKVFKIGRTSSFTAGLMFACFGTPKSIESRSNSYLYDDYCVVEAAPPFKRFSENGDSGAVVYTEDLMVVGFVVAGTSAGHTLVHVAHDCLDQLSIEAI